MTVKGRVTYTYEDASGPVFVVDIHGAIEATKVRLRGNSIDLAPEE